MIMDFVVRMLADFKLVSLSEWKEPMNEMTSLGGAVSQLQVLEIHEVTIHSWEKYWW